MILRIVKMHFTDQGRRKFISLYRSAEKKIAQSKGCIHLELLRDATGRNTYYTYSLWKSTGDLHRYRKSVLFKKVWPLAKSLLAEKAEAWTLKVPACKGRKIITV